MEDNPYPSADHSNSSSISLIWTVCVISLLFTYLIYTRNLVFGSEPGHWIYPYLEGVTFFPRWILVVVLASLGLFIFLGSRQIHSHEKTTLLASFFFAVLIQSLIRQVYPVSMSDIVQSDVTNSFYTPAQQYSAQEILNRFTELAPSLPLHARTNMPGKILLFELFRLLTESPEMMGYLVIGLSSCGALLLYGVCKKLFLDRRTAFYALTLYILIPCKLFFIPVLNTVTPVFMLLCFYLFLLYIEKKRSQIAWLLGIALYILILFEPSPLISGIVLVGIWLHAMGGKKFSIKDSWRLFIHLSLAFLSVYGIFYVFFSFNLFESFLYVLRDAVNFNAIYGRGYSTWVGENLKEFTLSVGVPIMILFIYTTAQIFNSWKNLKKSSFWTIETVYITSLLLTLTMITALGINRGEVTRLWIYLAVLFQVPASIFLSKIEKGDFPFFVVASTIVIQTVITLHRVGFMLP